MLTVGPFIENLPARCFESFNKAHFIVSPKNVRVKLSPVQAGGPTNIYAPGFNLDCFDAIHGGNYARRTPRKIPNREALKSQNVGGLMFVGSFLTRRSLMSDVFQPLFLIFIVSSDAEARVSSTKAVGIPSNQTQPPFSF